ncbi:MAG: DUF805 domain-containing protein [Puniceicoccales bacterium]|jgi:uncharacterized membrane protein YhaH (DUF805 family)/GTPase SAR1 family protein|nr:DUF805 domain-containing protein [Puniceicoccales bacterium]
MKKISIVGAEGSGKSVFISALYQYMDPAKPAPNLFPGSSFTAYYTAGVWDELQRGQWPKSTNTGVIEDLKWTWKDTLQNEHQLQMLDCAGQDFRQVFEAEDDNELSDRQKILKQEFFSSDLVIVLLNLQKALDIYTLPAQKKIQTEMQFAPASALCKLKDAGIKTFLCFTQCDRYMEFVENKFGDESDESKTEKNAAFARAVAACLPILSNAIQKTKTPLCKASAVETEYRSIPENKNSLTLLPKENCAPGNMCEIIQIIDDFLVEKTPPPLSPNLSSKKNAAAANSELDYAADLPLLPPLPPLLAAANSELDYAADPTIRKPKPFNLISTCFSVSFRGRASRREFNKFLLLMLSLLVLFSFASPSVWVWILFVGWFLSMSIVFIGLVIRRFHDINDSGWLIFLLLIPFVNLVIFLSLIFEPGTDGPNKYDIP